MGSLRGRTALVTGAARRVGRAIAAELAREGADVLVHYGHSAEEAERTAAGLRGLGVRSWTVRADLGDPGQVASLWEQARAMAGPIDILVNSASSFSQDTLAGFTSAALEASLRLNALAPVLLARLFAAAGQGPGGAEEGGAAAGPGTGAAANDAQPGGARAAAAKPAPDRVIVNLLDSRALGRMRLHFSYQAGKRLLGDFTRLLALELAPSVRVNAVAPGMILPPEGLDPQRQARLAATNLLGRWGRPEDVARAVLFLVSSDFITGQVLYVDGGGSVKESLFG
jgi:NAD(P)-dependent dehydrogenase (short-subunit alcohol dehydrogenase family)